MLLCKTTVIQNPETKSAEFAVMYQTVSTTTTKSVWQDTLTLVLTTPQQHLKQIAKLSKQDDLFTGC